MKDTEYFSTDEVCLILHQRKADVVRACLDNRQWCILRNQDTKERLFVPADINRLWRLFYGGRLRVKNVERIGNKIQLTVA